jgi:lysophospholipase L1-like esterase
MFGMKSWIALAVVGLVLPVWAQSQPSTDASTQPTPMPPAPVRPANEPKRQPGVPTLFLVGDSTMKVGTPGQRGWGEEIVKMFDPKKVRVLNRAMGGRSSRTFLTEGRWAAVLEDAQPGDFVIIQLGHNDSGKLFGDNRERGSIRGNSEDTEPVTLTLGNNKGKQETVHTYGWYIRKYVTDAKEHGLTPIVCSPVPRGPRLNAPFTYDPDPKPSSYRQWAKEAADEAGAKFIDLQLLIWKTYAGMTPAEIKAKYFTATEDSNTHSSPGGARHNAECVVEGLKSLKDVPLADFLLPADKIQTTQHAE